MNRLIIIIFVLVQVNIGFGQSVLRTMKRLPDTGETSSYTTTLGEDADYLINMPFFTNNGDGTVTDTITGLMWQKTDGGEMTFEKAKLYCDTLTLGGFSDWRLPNAHEAYSILNQQYSNPATDPTVFTTTAAEYWWSSVRQVGDSTKVWVTNAGGGIGNHPKSETVSAGGTKRIHARAVREITTPVTVPVHFTDNGDGSITDNLTNLVWQKIPEIDTITWEDALNYAENLSLAGKTDWRLPNIKELQSINDESISNPSISQTYFTTAGAINFWSSTTLPNQTVKAWYMDTQFGIVSHYPKTSKRSVICVSGNGGSPSSIVKNEVADLITIFPNPAYDFITVSSAFPSEIEISNIQGQIMKSINTVQTNTIIDVSMFPKGIYLVKLISDNNLTVRKFVKQ